MTYGENDLCLYPILTKDTNSFTLVANKWGNNLSLQTHDKREWMSNGIKSLKSSYFEPNLLSVSATF